MRGELQGVVRPLREPGYREALRRKVERARKRRLRLQRRKQEAKAAKEEEAARAAEREAKIDQWRAKCIQEVEEKNRVGLQVARCCCPGCGGGSGALWWSGGRPAGNGLCLPCTFLCTPRFGRCHLGAVRLWLTWRLSLSRAHSPASSLKSLLGISAVPCSWPRP